MSEAKAAQPRFVRGAKQIAALFNQYSHTPIDEKGVYRLIRRGTIRTGKDGTKLIAEESEIIADLLKAARASS